MVAISKVIFTACGLFQAAQAFCVYNRMTVPANSDGTEAQKIISINVWDARNGPK